MKTIPIENGNQVGILVTSAISIFIAAVSVCLRLVAKAIGLGYDYSDYCIMIALICNTALHTCCMLLVTYGGFGFHTIEVYERFGAETATFFFKGIMSFALLWNATVCFSKLSILLMYTTLIPIPSMLKWAIAIGSIVLSWNVANIIAGFLICRPLAKNWEFALPGTCGSQPAFYFAMGAVNLITDAGIILLPMPYLLRLRLPLRKKVLAMALLSVGIGTWVITIYRQTLLPGLDFADMTHSGVLATILSGLEPAVAIALACIPLMRPLLGRKAPNTNGSSYQYDDSKRSGLYSKKGSKTHGHCPLDTLTESLYDDENSSEVQLQPIKFTQNVGINPDKDEAHRRSLRSLDRTIQVETKWEITHNYNNGDQDTQHLKYEK